MIYYTIFLCLPQRLTSFILFAIIIFMLNKNKPTADTNGQPQNLNSDFFAVKEPKVVDEKKEKRSKKNPFSKLTKKQKIIAGVITAVILIGGCATAFALTREKPKPAPIADQPKIEEAPKTTEPSKTTGLEVPVEYNQRTVTGIQIENSPDARPQSGLKDADVIYEAVAEGGITRFHAIFKDNLPEYVGPVRSVRPYYLDFLGPYDGAIVHVGGSPQALAEIRAQGIKDLDQQSGANSSAYWREKSRYAPHNMYTNVVKLKEIEKNNGWTSTYEGFVRGGEDKTSATPNAKTVNIRMSSANYNVVYNYDAATNTYLRNEGGRPHMDAKSNAQLAPKVLVVPVVRRTQDGIYSVYAINDGGKVLIFQNGTTTEGTWSKAGRKAQFKFTGADGQPLKLAPGQTWVTLAASAGDVTFAP